MVWQLMPVRLLLLLRVRPALPLPVRRVVVPVMRRLAPVALAVHLVLRDELAKVPLYFIVLLVLVPLPVLLVVR